MLRNTTNYQQNPTQPLGQPSQKLNIQNQVQGKNQDANRSKPNFQEQVRHNNNDSDISDEDMGDIDENVVNNTAGGGAQNQRNQQQRNENYAAPQQSSNQNSYKLRGNTQSPPKYKSAGQYQQQNDQVSARGQQTQSLLKQPGFLAQNAKQQTSSSQSQDSRKIEMLQKISSPTQQSILPHQIQGQNIQKNLYESNQGINGQLSIVNEEIGGGQLPDPERETDFGKAYNKLVKKFYQEQGPNLLIPEEDLYKVEQRGVNINEVQRRIQEDAQKKEEKIRMLKAIQEEKELEGCTFAPTMLTKKKNNVGGEKRDLNKFLEDQQKYLELKQQKQNERKEKQLQSEQSVMVTQPMVNEKSKKLLEKKKKLQEDQKETLTREDTKEGNEKQNQRQPGRPATGHQQDMKKRLASPQSNETFKPNISKKSSQIAESKRAGQKIEDHLLLEGKKLQDKQAKRILDEKNQKTTKVTNKESEKYIIAKFNREFDHIIQEMFNDTNVLDDADPKSRVSDASHNLQKNINYLRLKELLIVMGMINEAAANADSNDRALLYELWKLLNGEEKEEIAIDDVRLVIMSILRMTEHKRIGGESSQKQTQQELEDPKNFGFYNNKGQFCLRTEDIHKIQKMYNIFYLNRLQHLGRLLEQSKLDKANQEQFNYKPQLNENSSIIAQKYRQKVADQIKEDKVTTFEWLAAAGNKQAWRDQAKQILQEEELKECTFKPQLISHNPQLDASKSQSTIPSQDKQSAVEKSNIGAGSQKYQQLYAMAKHQKDKQDKTKEDYEFERNQQECTFQPKLQSQGKQRNQVQQEPPHLQKDKHVQKQIDRLNKAREEKERIKMYTERGAMPPIKQPGDAMNISTISATSKRPTQTNAQNVQNRRSPHEGQARSNTANQQIRKKIENNTNIEYDKNGSNSIFNNNLLGSPDKEALNIEMNGHGSPELRDSAQKSTISDRTPLLFVDVNLGGDASERIVVFEGDTARELALRFCEEHNLDEDTLEKLEELLQSQISSVLTKIEEEEQESNAQSHDQYQDQE